MGDGITISVDIVRAKTTSDKTIRGKRLQSTPAYQKFAEVKKFTR
jgi:hypothetical protein